MIIWIDAQLSPALAAWISKTFHVKAAAVRDVGMRDASDDEIFRAAKKIGAVVMTKDSDFLRLLEQLGPPPKVLWLTCGNTSNDSLKRILVTTLNHALELLKKGDDLVEIADT